MNNDELLEELKRLIESNERKKGNQEEREERIDNKSLTEQYKDEKTKEEIEEKIEALKYLRGQAEYLETNFRDIKEVIDEWTCETDVVISGLMKTLAEIEIEMYDYFLISSNKI